MITFMPSYERLNRSLEFSTFMGVLCLKRYKGCTFFYKLVNSSRKKYDCWLTPKKSMEKDFMNTDLNSNIDKDVFYDSITDILKIKHFNKLKEFVI